MKVTRRGRITTHEVTLHLEKAPPFSNRLTRGKVWPTKARITYAYTWAGGSWHALKAEIWGFRNAELAGESILLEAYEPENWPNWLHAEVLKETPAAIKDGEMIK
jgi:hypothetical protein